MSERGVKETKEVLAFVFSMANAIKISLADGDFDWYDAKNFVDPLKKIAPAVENIDEVLPEIEDLSVDEIVELAKYSMTELGLGGDIDVDAVVTGTTNNRSIENALIDVEGIVSSTRDDACSGETTAREVNGVSAGTTDQG